MTRTRTLGRSGLQVSALGLGTAGIGGPYHDPAVREDLPVGYGRVDDRESIRAIQRALDLGITYFDTADVYGCGRSERVLGEALKGRRDEVVISTKFGHTFDASTQTVRGDDASPDYIRRACEASLRRLDTEWIDLYLFHLKNYDLVRASEVRDVLESLVDEGKIRYYGWSTDDVARAAVFEKGTHCTAVMHRLNYILDAPEMLDFCETHDLASLNRIPFLMGVLTGKYKDGSELPEEDVRSAFKTRAHVEDNAGAMDYGPLTPAQMDKVAEILERKA